MVVNSKAVIYSSDGDIACGDNLSMGSDSAEISFGADGEIKLTHVADSGLTLKHDASGDDKFATFTLAAGDNNIAVNDKLGAINFQAPDEGAGTDAVLVAAGIEAVSEGDFSASSNATKLVFKTAASEAAASKMELSSAGHLTVSAGGLTIADGRRIGIASDTDLMTLTDGVVTVAGEVSMTTLDIGGTNVTATAAELNLVDGGASIGTTAVADGHGILMNHGGTMAQTTVQTLAAYLDDEITAMPNLVQAGALNAGSISSGFGNIDNGSSTLSTGAATVASLDLNGDLDMAGAARDILMENNQNEALQFKQGSDPYLSFNTNNNRLDIAQAVRLSGTKQLQFQDDGTYIHSSADGQLDIVSDTTVKIHGNHQLDNETKAAANAGSAGIAGSTALSAAKQMYILTSDDSNKGWKLPNVADVGVGAIKYLVNKSANAGILYPQDTDAKISGNSSVTVPAGASLICLCTNTGGGTSNEWHIL